MFYPQKIHIFKAFAAFLFAATALFFVACGESKSKDIRAQSEGVIDYQRELFVEFDEKFTQKYDLKALLTNGELNAKVNGKDTQIPASVKAQTLRLDLPLKANSSYKVEFKLYETSVKLEFKTAPLKINFAGANFEQSDDESVFVASFNSSFEISDDDTKGILLEKNGEKLEFSLTKNENSKDYTLTSVKFPLTQKNQTLNLAFKKRILGLDKDLAYEFISNAKGELALQSALVKARNIELTFNTELDTTQNAKDFIRISPNLNYNAVISGSTIKLIGAFDIGQEYEITISQGLQARSGTKTNRQFSAKVSLADLEPSLAFASDGVFLPSSAKQKIAFKSLNVDKVKLKVYQIYANNIAEYLRFRNFQSKKKLSSNQSDIIGWDGEALEYTGDLILEREFELNSAKNKWEQNEIALNSLKNLSGVFVVSLSFDEKGTSYDFSELESWQKYDFFRDRAEVSKHIIFSNLALSAELINDEIFVSVRDFTTMKSASGVKIEAISKKNQILASANTNANGEANLQVEADKVLFLLASKGDDVSILRLSNPLSTDGFDTDGLMNAGKIKAFIYTERGVYRPGDSIHFNVVAKNDKGALTHPINLTLKDPQGKVLANYDKKKLEALNDGMFYEEIALDKDAPTGVYEATLDIGAEKFYQKILVQTTAPNRIEVDLKADEFININKSKKVDFKITSKYLFGAPASGLKARTTMQISKKSFTNQLYKNYIFENPSLYISRDYYDEDGVLNEQGVLKSAFELSERTLNSQGTNFNAFLSTEIYEQGGRSTKNALNLELRKYEYFVGIKRLENDYISSGDKITFSVIVSDLQNKLLKGKKLEYKIYQSRTSWWWDYDNYSEYLRSIKKDKNSQVIASGELVSGSEPVNLDFESKDKYGDMFIEIIDKQSGVSTGQNFYVSSWGAPNTANIQSALKIKSDKESYKVGEKAKIEFESVKGGVALITLSNNEGVIKRFVLDTKDRLTSFEVPLERAYAPNIYASVSLVQEYESWQNDRALRLFGVIPLRVNDEQSKLNLSLKAPDKILPQSEFEVEIQSSEKKPFTYTLAVVDEGLLSLTNFKTPDIWGYFYAKVGFKLKIFDTYDKIIAKTFGEVAKVLTTGGDAMLSSSAMKRTKKSKLDEQADRFKPVVLYQAPVKTDKKGYAKVRLTMPPYMGSVRVMAVGANDKAFGAAEKNVLVSAPVVMLETLPRSLRINDEFKLLVQVFKVDKDVKTATISLKNKNHLVSFDKSQIKVDFSKGDTQSVYFNVKVNAEQIGVEELEFKLEAGKYAYTSQTEIDIKAKNAYAFESENFIIKAGESKEFSVASGYVKGSTNAVLKLSPTPILNLDKRLNFLLRYPYGCIEQTTSAVLPQLYLDKFSYKADKQKIINNINAAIARFEHFQTADGGFAYWQGGRKSDIWGSNYAGMFLLAAKEAGYFVPQSLYNRWLNYEKSVVKRGIVRDENLLYRTNSLFLLALAKEPNVSMMNVLYEQRARLDTASLWQLAAAYKLAGLDDIALKIAQGASIEPNLNKADYEYNYGSVTRDKAIIANAYKIIYGKNHSELLQELGASLQSNEYLSTQSAGYALYALALGLNLDEKKQGEPMNATLNINGKSHKLSEKSAQSFEFSDGKASVSTQKDLFASFGVEGIRLDNAKPFEKNLELKRKFFDDKGREISEDEIKSSKTFYMGISVSQKGDFGTLRNVALTQVLPSGWEVANTLLAGQSKVDAQFKEWNSNYDFIDIRDDKIMWFFSLESGASKNATKTFFIKLNAITPGKYNLSGAFVEAMYDDNFGALSEGKSVIVGQ